MSHAPGTLFVLHSGGFISWVIRLLTRSRVNHAGVCVGDGSTVEAQAAGAVSKQEQTDPERITYGSALLTRIETCSAGRGVIIAAEATKLLGTPYNFLDLVALTWAALKTDPTDLPSHPNWWQARIMRDDRLICSQLVDLACLRAGVHLFVDNRLPGQVTPGDLAEALSNPTWPILIDQ